ncbi:MAG: sigma 54-interacting transcriptional regulator [Bacillota bacterium]|nr:sigma 54-interacting transcriptional regulator [Bacillota bacterium]
MEILRKILNFSTDGYIAIDESGNILEYNAKAKEIFGIINKNTLGHKSGYIEKDDCVVIVDNALGFDDGNLSEEDLLNLGIEEEIKFGEGFIYIGNSADFVFSKGKKRLEVSNKYNNREIKASINPIKRELMIEVDSIVLTIQYIFSFGHMVIISPEGKIKFYQEYGYTARGESIREILKGKHFIEKSVNKGLDVEGKSVDALHSGEIIRQFKSIAESKGDDLLKQSITINGKPLICDIFSDLKGAWMRIEDVSEYRSLILSKEKILKELNKLQSKMSYSEKYEEMDFIGNSREIIKVRELAYKASQSKSNVVLSGESGTGKSLLARKIHKNSIFSKNPFIEVNCSAIPENLFESEFFGYEKGAFTGANALGKKGFFELANKGTLFLDEIVELSFPMQSKLLNVLQNRSFYRVGGTEEVKVEFRLIVASNQSLDGAVKEKIIREDLYYRLNVFPIYIPALRERKEDVSLLVHNIIPKIRNNTFKEYLDISEDAIILLSNYSWPGNVRELENIIERTANMVDHEVLSADDFDIVKDSDANTFDLKQNTTNNEKKLIEKVLELVDGDKKKAMELLNIKKTAFYEKTKKYNI